MLEGPRYSLGEPEGNCFIGDGGEQDTDSEKWTLFSGSGGEADLNELFEGDEDAGFPSSVC